MLQESSAATCADVLISNDLRGNDSHGVSNMLRKVIKNPIKSHTKLYNNLFSIPIGISRESKIQDPM